ncbi:hypothetical protein [Undibacterium parvum]|uniref:Uncharacterized protein n=1 Tax=Undibacterium parvum TaxID=401471 RepID=A0A3Q9BT35_9BURK|nr:hypothetical protein [Undibacterium parvum]AZP13036.1 hypothetical protein EJN92_14125 [Undibacterium parvum]
MFPTLCSSFLADFTVNQLAVPQKPFFFGQTQVISIGKYLYVSSAQAPEIKLGANGENAKTSAPTASAANAITAVTVNLNVSPQKARNTAALSAFNNSPMQFPSRKDAARERIAWIKMQLEGLMRFAGVAGNPREAIRLAKELAAAVREYGGGDTGPAMPQVSVGSASQASTGESGATSELASGEASDKTVNETANASAATAATSETSAAASLAAQVMSNSNSITSKQLTQNSGQDSEQDSEQNSVQTSAENSAAAAQVTQALAQAMHFAMADPASKERPSTDSGNALAALAQVNTSGLSAPDRAFLAEAKILMGKIKLLIALESKKAEDDKKAQQASKEMDDAFETATMSLMQENTSLAYAANGQSVSETSSAPILNETA